MDNDTREAELQAAYERGQKIGGTAVQVAINLIPMVMMWRAAHRGDTPKTVAWGATVIGGSVRRWGRPSTSRLAGDIVLGAVRTVKR